MQNVYTKPSVNPALSPPPGSLISSKLMRSSIYRLPTRDQIRSYARRTSSLVGCGDQSVPPRRRYARHTSTPRSLRSTLVKNSTAPACIACTVIGISPWPVIKIIGMARSASASRCCSSSPLRPGSRHRRERRDPEPHRPQEVREGLAQRRIIIDDADQGLGLHHAPSSLPIGTVNCTTAPWGTLAVAHSRPPCASIIRRLIASPRPRPCGLVV
jgi:hypothetical protein